MIKVLKKIILLASVVLSIGIGVVSYSQILKITGVNVDGTLPPPPPPCSTFNISGPLSSLDVGNFAGGTFPQVSQLALNIVSSSGTFGFAFKQQDVLGGGRTLHIKVGTLSPLSLIIDQTVQSWPPTAQEDSGYGFGASANGYVLNFRPDAFFQPLQRRTVLYSADNGTSLSVLNFTETVGYFLDSSSNQIGLTFDGGRFYNAYNVGGSVGPNGIAAWNHGISNITNTPSFNVARTGFGYDGVSKVYANIDPGGVSPPLLARFAKFNGSNTVVEATFDPGFSSSDTIGGLVFGNGKLFISNFPSGVSSIKVARVNGNPFSVEQSINLSIGDGDTYSGSRLAFDSTNNKLYLISMAASNGRRIFRLNPTNLNVEQVATIGGAGLSFRFEDGSLHVSSNGRRMYTLEVDGNIQHYFIREYGLCS